MNITYLRYGAIILLVAEILFAPWSRIAEFGSLNPFSALLSLCGTIVLILVAPYLYIHADLNSDENKKVFCRMGDFALIEGVLVTTIFLGAMRGASELELAEFTPVLFIIALVVILLILWRALRELNEYLE